MSDAAPSKPSFIRQLFKRKIRVVDEADYHLDTALECLAQATREHDEACARVRRRQDSDKSLRIVAVAAPQSEHPAE